MILQHLVTFCRVVEEGSFTQAAESLHLTQPTVTKQIQALEDEMGQVLVSRDGRQARLTAAGEIVHSYARRIINLVQDCHNAVSEMKQPGAGALIIGAVPNLVLSTLPKPLEDYTGSHPLVSVHVHTGTNAEVLQMVLRNDIDVGLATIPISHPEIIGYPLYEDKILLVTSPQRPYGVAKPLTPEEFSAIPMISYKRKSHFWAFVDAAFHSAGIMPNIVMEFDSHQAVKTMAQLGLGIAMLPASSVRNEIANGQLLVGHIKGLPPIGRVTTLITRRDRQPTTAMIDFIDTLRDYYPAPHMPVVSVNGSISQ